MNYKLFIFHFSKETKVSELKVYIKEKTGLELNEQRLCFGTKPLEDHYSFEDVGITNMSTVFLVVRMRGGQDMVDLLRASPLKTIQKTSNCPSFRACPSCGTLLEHTEGCNTFNCWNCKVTFCFICLKLGQNGSLTCTGSNCTNLAPVQTYIPNQ